MQVEKVASIRFYNVASQGEGIVENCRGGFWRAVCDMNWNYLNQWRRKMFLSRGAESKEVKTRFTCA